MLADDKIGDLMRMFQLFRRVDPEVNVLQNGLTANIKAIGKEINATVSIAPTPPPDSSMIPILLHQPPVLPIPLS